MSLRAVIRTGTRAMLPAARVGSAVRFPHSGTLKERERAAEAIYFNKEEEKLLRRLLSKVKSQTEVADKPAAAASVSVERQRLDSILAKYNVSEADKDALVAWRHSHDF